MISYDGNFSRPPIPACLMWFNRRWRSARVATRGRPSSFDAGAAALHGLLDLREGRHRGISGRGHRQGAVCGPALNRPLRTLVREKPVYEPRGKRVAAPDAIEDLEVFTCLGLVELPVDEADRAPIVTSGGLGVA